MIVVTGAAGFIASVFCRHLNAMGITDLVLSDDFSKAHKQNNYSSIQYTELVNRDILDQWIQMNHLQIQAVFHLGARTDTTEKNIEILNTLNLFYSQKIWNLCSEFQIPLIYASSAATYGSGEYGYDDNHEIIKNLQPLNPYGISKNEFDKWVLLQSEINHTPPHWYGCKFFNVYGPNEYHKGRMASVVFHAFHQITENGTLRLFRSHIDSVNDGEQKRDFIYVKDVAKILFFLFQNKPECGIYNVGSGHASTFNELAKAVFNTLQIPESIEYINIPEDIRNTYQYYTQANMNKLRTAGFTDKIMNIQEGVKDYVLHYLKSTKHF
jgi:ADP-L-glycero-D-manno-heptose 6-epimerase